MSKAAKTQAPGPGLTARYRIWRAGVKARPAQFAIPPEPRSIGSAAIGRQICEGQVLIAGRRVSLEGASIWEVSLADGRDEADRHGFTWLDDLAAHGTREAAQISRDWLCDWLRAYDNGRGPGWRADIAARRLVRWVHHATSLCDGMDKATEARFRRALSRHVLYLGGSWRRVPQGIATFESLTGLIQGGLALKGMEPRARPAIKSLERLCKEGIDRKGGLASRNPEELLNLFTMLVWTEMVMSDVGLMAQPEHRAAIARIAPVLRSLRHADGGLARFHGGGRGVEGRLDASLAASRVRSGAAEGLAMGFARLARGRSSVVLDAARPPLPPHNHTAHASTLAFELTVGRRPLVVNCGSGIAFGSEWAKAARATPAHSTLAPEGTSSGKLKPARRGRSALLLSETARDVRCEPAPERGPSALSAVHDAFAHSHGLTHLRRLDLGPDGRNLSGEDILTAVTEVERRRFNTVLRQRNNRGLGFTLRFHLHPDVTATMGEDGTSVDLMLKSGELWQFRQVSSARISLDPSVYLEKTRPQPVPTRQIVLESVAVEYSTTIRWSFMRMLSQELNQRDLYRDELSIT